MREPATSIRSLVGTDCAIAGASAKAQNVPPANNCPAASGNAFILEDTLTPFGRNFIEFKFLWSKFETYSEKSRGWRETIEPVTPTLQQCDLPPQRKVAVATIAASKLLQIRHRCKHAMHKPLIRLKSPQWTGVRIREHAAKLGSSSA